MELVGTVKKIRSIFVNESSYLYYRVKKTGLVFELNYQKGNEYRCCRCRELKTQRCITIINEEVIAQRKHPEDDHHPDCEPFLEAIALARRSDREMRHVVRSTG